MSGKNEGDKGKKTVQRKKPPTASDEADPNLEAASAETDLDQLGELPRSYGSDTIFLVAQEPHWLFTYWDIDISRHPGGPTFLRAYQSSDTPEAEIEVPFETRNWYIPVKVAGGQYTVEIGYYRGNTWNAITRSMTIQTPPDRISGSEQFDCATIPLHLSFQRLIDSVQDSIRQGESLTQAIAHAQRNGRFAPLSPEAAPDVVTSAKKDILQALVGPELLNELSSGSFSSEEMEERIRLHLEQKLSSQASGSEFLPSGLLSSEILSSIQWGSAETSLFAALTAFSSGGESASWSTAALSSWAAVELSSGLLAGGAFSSWESKGESSWGAKAESSWGERAESSWTGKGESSWSGLSSWSGGSSWTGGSSWGAETSSLLSNFSSGEFAALSSWLESVKSSWFQAAQSSWTEAALSSWNQAAVTSWSQAATSSWGGASENLSSFGQARNFFMHVNAEVIFYGGTDPKAKVTIDGKPITLNPDGTFRYHFIFPDDTYEIPIVATSPDGVETRSAMLRFERGTEKVGQVDNTGQPPLGTPMGSRS